MNYVEMLRVRNVLRILAIVLGALLVVGVIIRISVAGQFDSNVGAYVDRLRKEPDTRTIRSVAGGVAVTTITNAREHVTITIHDGPAGHVVQIDEPVNGAGEHDDAKVMGGVKVSESIDGGVRRTIVENVAVPFMYFLAYATFVGLIIATILGATFARENEGHLEIALLKPVSRVRYAAGAIAIDFAGIVIAEVMALVAAWLGTALFGLPHFDFNDVTVLVVATVVFAPFAWQAMLNAATASLRRGAGALVGFSWLMAFGIIGASQIPLGSLPLARTVHGIFWVLAHLIPLDYVSLSDNGAIRGSLTDPQSTAIIAGLLVIYCALAVWQWRRLEA